MKKLKLNDGAYTNLITGLGTLSMDKASATKASCYREGNLSELARMKVSDGIADRIVSSIPETALKQEITIIGDKGGEILTAMTKAGMIEAMQTAGEYQRLTGGALIVTEYDDVSSAKDLEKPVSDAAKILNYRVYSSGRVNLNAGDFVGDDPQIFRVVRRDGAEVIVHPSRCVVIHGKALPDVLDFGGTRESFFGSSALKTCETSLKNLASVVGAITNMAVETGTTVFNLDGLNEMLSRPDCGIKDVQNLMSMVKLSMNSMRAVFAGANDNFSILSHNFGGLPEIMQKLMNQVSADSGIPASILFGQTATGLSQTNTGDLKAYGELVESWRNRYLFRPMTSLIKDYALRMFGRSDVSEFAWGQVSVMSTEELLNAKKLQADTLEKYFTMGVLSNEEIRNSVFLNGHSFEVSVE